jgi:hypothetical protein
MIIRSRRSYVRNSWKSRGFRRATMTDLQKSLYRFVLYLGPIFVGWTR